MVSRRAIQKKQEIACGLVQQRQMSMNAGDLFFGRRIRQNHALEHATVTILGTMVPDLRVSARSSGHGFLIFGDVDVG